MYRLRSLGSRETGYDAVSREVRIQEIIIFLPGSLNQAFYSAFVRRVRPQNDNFFRGFFEERCFSFAAPTKWQTYFL
jgi:hypothetical protein